jgi:predicted esterase
MKMLLVLLALAACGGKKDPPLEREFIHLTTKFINGAGSTAPLLVGLHGKGSDPDRFERLFDALKAPVELAIARGPVPDDAGWAWFEWPRGLPDAELAVRIDDAADRVWSAIQSVAHGRPVYVIGFSQGAVVAYALAAKHPELAYAFPISGGLPPPLYPKTKAAPVFAVHGVEDDVVAIGWDQATINAFRTAGGTAELVPFPKIQHHIAPEMRDAVYAKLTVVLAPTP